MTLILVELITIVIHNWLIEKVWPSIVNGALPVHHAKAHVDVVVPQERSANVAGQIQTGIATDANVQEGIPDQTGDSVQHVEQERLVLEVAMLVQIVVREHTQVQPHLVARLVLQAQLRQVPEQLELQAVTVKQVRLAKHTKEQIAGNVVRIHIRVQASIHVLHVRLIQIQARVVQFKLHVSLMPGTLDQTAVPLLPVLPENTKLRQAADFVLTVVQGISPHQPAQV